MSLVELWRLLPCYLRIFRSWLSTSGLCHRTMFMIYFYFLANVFSSVKHGLENVGLSTRTHITLMIQRPEIMWRIVYTFWGRNCRSQDSTYVCKQWAPTWRFHSASYMKIAREFTCSPNIVSTTRIKSHCDTLLSLRIRIEIISLLFTSFKKYKHFFYTLDNREDDGASFYSSYY